MIVALMGGVGLFLLGMVLLTEGMKSFAGKSLRSALLRFTDKPLRAFASGALVTALVQSSSATTLATIGFVSAGMLGFSQAIGLVMGASLGTTSTGWLVSTLGLKFSITQAVLPLIALGTFIRLFGKGRFPSLGIALAGFGLIFIGIDFLQAGMAGLTDRVDLASLPGTGISGHALMMLIGLVLTVVMQSSSAATATILAALHEDAVSFEQSASMVIGAAIGTTVTAALAAIGGSVAARRTALAHVLFNLFTGLVALLFLPLFLGLLAWLQENFGLDRGAVSLAAFHTLFILIGVLIVLPFVGPFSRLIERIIPEKGPRLTRHLDPSLLALPPVAMEAVRRSLRETADLLWEILTRRLQGDAQDRHSDDSLLLIQNALAENSGFITRIPPTQHDAAENELRSASFHAIDHLSQLLPCAEQAHSSLAEPPLQQAAKDCRSAIESAKQLLLAAPEASPGLSESLQSTSTTLAAWRKTTRLTLLENSASGAVPAEQTLELLETVRWIDQIAYHTWRAAHYLQKRE